MKTLREQWEHFEETWIPKKAGKVQREETEKAFYVGAAAFLHLMEKIGTDLKPGPDEVERGAELLEQLRLELIANLRKWAEKEETWMPEAGK